MRVDKIFSVAFKCEDEQQQQQINSMRWGSSETEPRGMMPQACMKHSWLCSESELKLELSSFFQQMGNTIHATWETTATSALPVWWARGPAAVKLSVVEYNVSIMMLYWFFFLNKWKIILVIHQQPSMIKVSLALKKRACWAASNKKQQYSCEVRTLTTLCPSRDTGGHGGGPGGRMEPEPSTDFTAMFNNHEWG